MKYVRVLAAAVCLQLVLVYAPRVLAQQPAAQPAPAAQAPAAQTPTPGREKETLQVPVMVVHGDMDTAVPVSLSRTWVEVMKALKMPHQYIEVAGGDHGSVISSHQADIFAFFAKYSK
jgi:dipeptidyl aminopeptidase/acylaminoacyl peptidase